MDSRNARAFNNLFVASLLIFVLPLLSVYMICKTDQIVGPEVDIDARIWLAGIVSSAFVILVMIGIVVIAIVEPEPEWAKDLRKTKNVVAPNTNTKPKRA